MEKTWKCSGYQLFKFSSLYFYFPTCSKVSEYHFYEQRNSIIFKTGIKALGIGYLLSQSHLKLLDVFSLSLCKPSTHYMLRDISNLLSYLYGLKKTLNRRSRVYVKYIFDTCIFNSCVLVLSIQNVF